MARVGAIGVIVAAALAADGETLNAAVDALGVAGGAFVAAVVLAAAARRGRRRELHSAAARPMTAGMSARVSATDAARGTRAAGTEPPTAALRCEEPRTADGRPLLSGEWRRESAENVEAYLAAAGVRPAFLRKALARANGTVTIRREVHALEAREEEETCDVESKTSLSKLSFHYRVGGASTTTTVNNNVFEDTMLWRDSTLVLTKRNAAKGFAIVVERILLGDGNHMRQSYRVVRLDGSAPDTLASEIYARR